MSEQRIAFIPTRRAAVAPKLNHLVPAVVLILSALEGLSGERHGGIILPLIDLIVGGALLALLARELKPGRKVGHAGIDWLDIVAGLVIIMEAAHRYNPRKGFQPSWLYFLTGLATIRLGMYHGRIGRSQGLFLSNTGFRFKRRIFRKVTGSWEEIDRIEQLPKAVRLVWKDGRSWAMNLRTLENREEIRTSLQKGLDAYRLHSAQTGIQERGATAGPPSGTP